MLGQKAKEQYGFEGVVSKEFKNFADIHSKYINDKNVWLALQDKPFTSENLEEKWYVLLLDQGGSCLSPLSKLMEMHLNDAIPHER